MPRNSQELEDVINRVEAEVRGYQDQAEAEYTATGSVSPGLRMAIAAGNSKLVSLRAGHLSVGAVNGGQGATGPESDWETVNGSGPYAKTVSEHAFNAGAVASFGDMGRSVARYSGDLMASSVDAMLAPEETADPSDPQSSAQVDADAERTTRAFLNPNVNPITGVPAAIKNAVTVYDPRNISAETKTWRGQLALWTAWAPVFLMGHGAVTGIRGGIDALDTKVAADPEGARALLSNPRVPRAAKDLVMNSLARTFAKEAHATEPTFQPAPGPIRQSVPRPPDSGYIVANEPAEGRVQQVEPGEEGRVGAVDASGPSVESGHDAEPEPDQTASTILQLGDETYGRRRASHNVRLSHDPGENRGDQQVAGGARVSTPYSGADRGNSDAQQGRTAAAARDTSDTGSSSISGVDETDRIADGLRDAAKFSGRALDAYSYLMAHPELSQRVGFPTSASAYIDRAGTVHIIQPHTHDPVARIVLRDAAELNPPMGEGGDQWANTLMQRGGVVHIQILPDTVGIVLDRANAPTRAQLNAIDDLRVMVPEGAFEATVLDHGEFADRVLTMPRFWRALRGERGAGSQMTSGSPPEPPNQPQSTNQAPRPGGGASTLDAAPSQPEVSKPDDFVADYDEIDASEQAEPGHVTGSNSGSAVNVSALAAGSTSVVQNRKLPTKSAETARREREAVSKAGTDGSMARGRPFSENNPWLINRLLPSEAAASVEAARLTGGGMTREYGPKSGGRDPLTGRFESPSGPAPAGSVIESDDARRIIAMLTELLAATRAIPRETAAALAPLRGQITRQPDAVVSVGRNTPGLMGRGGP